MKKGTIGIIAVVAIVVMYAISAYNGMVNDQESATTALANVQSAYQRRADLIPNLVEVVKGYAKHEEETFKGVVEARAKATQITIDPSNCTPEQLKEFQAAQGELSSALGKLLAVQENYPELRLTKTSRTYKFSSKEQKTESTKLVTSSTLSYKLITRTSAPSQRIFLPVSLASRRWTNSRQMQMLRTLLKFHFKIK